MPLAPHVQQPLGELLNALYHLETSAGGGMKRAYSAIFQDLPDRLEYPDYYLVIKEPRCLNGIFESLQRGSYSSPQAVAYDLFLIWSNAREYNEQGSMVYADADKLEGYMERLWRERAPPLPPFESLPRPGSLPAPQPTAPDTERKPKRIKLTGALAGGPSTPSPGLVAPSAVKHRNGPSASPAPPSATPSLTLKLGGSRAPPTPAPPPPLPSLPSMPALLPATMPDLPVASTSAAGTASRDISVAPGPGAPEAGAEGEEGAAGTPGPSLPTIGDVESGWMSGDVGPNPMQAYLDILDKIRKYTDATGRPLATPLIDVPDRAARPDYYQLVDRPLSLNSIEANVHAGVYGSPEAFDQDLHHLFSIAKLFIRPDSPGTVYSDLMVLQRLYQELTKQVSPSVRSAIIDDAAALASVGAGPGNVQHAKGDESAVGTDFKSRATTRPTTKDKVFLDGINFKGDFLKTGDWVHLLNPDNPGKPIIAQIWKTYKRPESAQRCLSVCWYYRPEETVHPASRTFYENEVFKTGVFVDHVVEDFVDRCFVMFFTKYTRGRPRAPAWTPAMPLYVCEFRYKDDVKAFKKIKSWSSCVPEEMRKHEYEFEPYPDDRVDTLHKIKSPFVRGVAGPGRLDSGAGAGGAGAAVGAAASPTYHFSQDGKPATAQEVKDEGHARDLVVGSGDSMQVDPSSTALAVDAALASFGAPPQPQPMTVASGPSASDLSTSAALAAFSSSLDILPGATSGTASTPTVELASAPAAAPTPAELAAANEAFAPLPPSIASKFRSDTFGDVLWFAAPGAAPPASSAAASDAGATHSLEYLYWRAMQKRERERAAAEAA
ncbi:hypothetical protein JCM8208_000372 [Rhodotorula glutinis]